jgi:hypothetical protein
MFYPVKLTAPGVPCEVSKADAWYVHLAVGSKCLKWFFSQLPSPLPFIAWSRDLKKSGPIRIWPMEKVGLKVNHSHG